MSSASDAVEPLLRALGKIPAGILVLTVGSPEQSAHAIGTLVSFVQQVSMDPPLVIVALKKGRASHTALTTGQARAFVLNITAANDKTLAKKYAQSEQIGSEAFAGVAHRALGSGQTFLTAASAYIECQLVKVVDIGADHDLIVGRPISGAVLSESHTPAVHLRADGSKY